MSLPLTILLLMVVFAGIAMQFAGLYIRRGDRPSCRKCSYDLTTHLPANCPECNADLNEEGAIAKGERRPRLAWIGSAVLVVGVLGLAYLMIQSPKLDHLKPVWLLRAEMAVVNDQGDERILKELGRRVQAVGASAREKDAIGRLAVDLVTRPVPDASAYKLLQSAALARAISPEQAEPIILKLIEQWSAELRSEDSFAHGSYVHREVLGALIESVGIEIDKLRPVIEAGLKAAAMQVMPDDKLIENLDKGCFTEQASLLVQNDEDEVAAGLVFYRVSRELERVGDFMKNIAEYVVYLGTGEIFQHAKH